MSNPVSRFLARTVLKSAVKEQAASDVQKATEDVLSRAATSIYGGVYPQSAYSGGQGTGSKFTKGFGGHSGSLTFDHVRIRQNVREKMQDSTSVKMIVSRYVDTVVNTGFKLKPAPVAKILGITEEQAEQWAEDVQDRFDLWASSKESDRAGINNFYQNQALYHMFQQRDNDIFTRFYYSKDRNLINPLQLSFVDPNQIRGYGWTNTWNQYFYDDGIERDAQRREIAYKIYNYTKDEYKETRVLAKGPKSGRTMMIHGFDPEYAGQGRGYSKFAHVLQDIELKTDFKISHIMKAIQQTIFAMYVKPGPDNPATNPIDDAVGPREATTLNTLNNTRSVDGLANENDDPVVSYKSMPEATFDVPGSVGVFNLKEGEDLKPFQQTAPVDKYDSFVSSFFKHISAAMNMPAEVALMNFEQNYSASRGALILFWEVAKRWRKEMKADFLDYVYESWLSEEIAAGRVKAPGWSNTTLKRAWLNAVWAGAPMPNIDPMKTMKADKGYVEMGAQTLDDVAENLNGSSGKKNRAALKRQYEELPESPFDKKQEPQAEAGVSNNNAMSPENQALLSAIENMLEENFAIMEA